MRNEKVIAMWMWLTALLLGLFLAGPSAPAWGQAVGEGVVSIPDPNAPGEPLPDGGSIAIEVAPGSPIHGTNVRAAGGPFTGTQAELSMAASGPSIVITFNGGPNGGGYVTSTDGGVTFGPMTSPPRPMGSNPCCDTGVAADLIGRFYYLELYRNDGAGNCTNSLHVSTNGGQTFGGIVGSPFSYASGTTDFPDMPHMGIDRVNLVGGNPQLYVFSRHFTSGINCPQTGGAGTVQGEVVCSTNGGAAWTAPIVLAPFTDTAHLATGSDGSVYIVGNGLGGTILLRRSTNDCNTGLAFGGAVTVASGLTYGGAGIDREFPQPYVVVDQFNSDRVYVAWSSDRLAADNDRDIFLARCDFVGTSGTCDSPVRINDNPIGDLTAQYFPMLCIDPNNRILLSWNDRRTGQVQIFHTEVDGAGMSVGPSFLVSEVAFTPFNFGGTPDYGDYNENNQACDGNHLYVAWSSQVSPPGITPASNDVDVFFAVVNNLADVRVQGALEFGNVPVTPVGGEIGFRDVEFEVLNVGDATLTVNSVTCVAGNCTDFSVLSNPTTPLLVSPDARVSFVVRFDPTAVGARTATIRVSTNDADQPTINLTANGTGAVPAIQVSPGTLTFGNVPTNPVGGELGIKDLPLKVRNQGSSNLQVTNITAFGGNFADFTVLTPMPGFPTIISPDAEFDFQIRCDPSAAGPRSTTIRVTSNSGGVAGTTTDAAANCTGAVPDINLTGALDFGKLTGNEIKDLTIQSLNTGSSNLSITNIFLTGDPAFTIQGAPTFPLILSPDAHAEITVRCSIQGPAGVRTATLTIESNDPDEASVVVAASCRKGMGP